MFAERKGRTRGSEAAAMVVMAVVVMAVVLVAKVLAVVMVEMIEVSAILPRMKRRRISILN